MLVTSYENFKEKAGSFLIPVYGAIGTVKIMICRKFIQIIYVNTGGQGKKDQKGQDMITLLVLFEQELFLRVYMLKSRVSRGVVSAGEIAFYNSMHHSYINFSKSSKATMMCFTFLES